MLSKELIEQSQVNTRYVSDCRAKDDCMGLFTAPLTAMVIPWGAGASLI